MSILEINNLHVSIEGKEILKGVNLTLKTGEVAAIMGTKWDRKVYPFSSYYGKS